MRVREQTCETLTMMDKHILAAWVTESGRRRCREAGGGPGLHSAQHCQPPRASQVLGWQALCWRLKRCPQRRQPRRAREVCHETERVDPAIRVLLAAGHKVQP